LTEPQRCTVAEIRNLVEGETFKGSFVVQKIARRKDRNDHPFWDLYVMDPTGIIDGKVWSDAAWFDYPDEGEAVRIDGDERLDRDALDGQAVGLRGKKVSFNGRPQVNFTALFLLDQKSHPPHEFVQRSPIALEDLERRFSALRDLCPERLKAFLDLAFSGERGDRFRVAPAAVSHHHAYVHGLLEHTVCVAENALALAEVNRSRGIAVDVGVTVAGALLHDLGKIESYTLNPTPEVTVEGTFLDHIPLGFALFSRLADEFGLEKEIRTLLGHIILSHHGQKEYGSPVLPASPEALIVAAADELDFRLFCWEEAVSDLEGGQEISEYHRSTQRRFWKWNQASDAGSES